MDLVSQMSDRLLFAVPKKGRLYEKCLQFLEGADIKFSRSHRLDIALSLNMPVALIFLPAADIPRFVGEGNCDLGITGQDQVAESQLLDDHIRVTELLDLEFGKCKLQVQVPAHGEFQTAESLVGKRVVTSFDCLVKDYFRKLESQSTGKDVTLENMSTEVKYVGGSVEAACALGVADGIVDLVESGETMKAAGLKAIETVMDTSCCLIQSRSPRHPELISTILSRITGYISAQKYLLCNFNVPRSCFDACVAIAPGKRAPTVQNLLSANATDETEPWHAVSVMVPKKDVANIMDKLQKAGAHDILIFHIQNSRA
ncbi:ATP phosphoribosyltransferase (ATP-PRTase) (ATP-PRT) [Savitreella phatthalungensis]